jgi:hypothetical protein
VIVCNQSLGGNPWQTFPIIPIIQAAFAVMPLVTRAYSLLTQEIALRRWSTLGKILISN